jgi:hypothetical protein
MSSKPLQVELPDGQVIWARVAVDGPQNVKSDTLRRLDIDDLSRTVHGVSSALQQAVGDLAPDKVEVEFGLELALKSGAVISMLAEAGATASVKVTLAWEGKEAEGHTLTPGAGAPTVKA